MSHKHPIIYLRPSECSKDKIKYGVYESTTYIKRHGKKLLNVSKVYTLAEVLYANDGTFEHASFYKHGLTRHKGIDLIKECLLSNNLSIGDDLKVVVELDGTRTEIALSDYTKSKNLYFKLLIDPVVTTGMKANPLQLAEGPKRLKFAALKCEDNSSIVIYMIYDRGYKSKSAVKKHIRTWATAVCDTQTEQVKQVHYHKWAFRIDPNGIDLVRQCLKDNEWELDEDSVEAVRALHLCNGKWIKQYVPLSEFLEHKKEYNINKGKVLN